MWAAAYVIHTPPAALLPSPCSAELSVLVKACLSLSQTRKGFYPQPARRFVQIPEVLAPICRAAASQASPVPFIDGGAGHCFKLLSAAKMTLQLWVEIGCSDEMWSPRAGCRVWWGYTLPREERSSPSRSARSWSPSTRVMSRQGSLPLLVPALHFKKYL